MPKYKDYRHVTSDKMLLLLVFNIHLIPCDLDMQWTVTIQTTYEEVIKLSLKSSLVKFQLLICVHFEPMAKVRKLK